MANSTGMVSGNIELTEEKKNILKDFGYQLILGGPGSGKTTISILKADQWIKRINSYQKVLFLSFARASVARVIEAINEQQLIDNESIKRIDVDTYHAFFWRILKAHGYLLGLPRKLTILSPSNEAIALSDIRNSYGKVKDLSEQERKEKEIKEKALIKRTAFETGEIAFDLFASFTFQLLNESKKINHVVSTSYPVIILDEFQDTNLHQWEVVKCIGENSLIIALADSEQRIFEFIGADPERINHYKKHFSPNEFDLGNENHRSNGTDIVEFGNDIVKGRFQEDYTGISLHWFRSNVNQALSSLRFKILKSRKRLIGQFNSDWTLAVLVPTKKMVRQVSDYLSQNSIHHYAVIDMHGAVLAAELIAFLLQPKNKDDIAEYIQLLCNFFNGKGGDLPTKRDISEALSIQKAFAKYQNAIIQGVELPKNSILRTIVVSYNVCRDINLIGDPYDDWLAVRDALETSGCPRLKMVALEAKNLRLLNRGTQLRESLSQNWRDNGCYSNALGIVRQAFIIEHFAISKNPEKGVLVMNMHKSKGKQFDEVIIFEGWPIRVKGKIVSNPDRIVNGNMRRRNLENDKFLFRVSVTRAKYHTSILTPEDDPCVLLL